MNEKEIRFIDLFGGIGGFRLGLERANKVFQKRQMPDEEGVRDRRDSSDTPSKGKGEHGREYTDDNRRHIQEQKGKGISARSSFAQERTARVEGGRIGIDTQQGSRDKEKWSEPQPKRSGRRNIKEFRCVWYCDIDKYAVQTYNKNFREKHKPTDITTVKPSDIPDFDMLCAGFPCQSFSVAGKREGFQDTRGSLFFEICRIAQEKKPRMLLLENVKGLLSHDKGKTYRIILKSLDELGYNVEWQVLNSKNFGVPQNRERVFIIGHLRGTGGQQVFPLKKGHGTTIPIGKKQKRKEVAWGLRGRDYKDGTNFIIHNIYGGFNEKEPRVFEDYSPTIRTPKGGGHLPMIYSRSHGFNNGGARENPNMRFSSIQNELVDNIRRLTPVECERLQSFRDGWTDGVSDTQRYKQLGNAVTVNVIEAIGRSL